MSFLRRILATFASPKRLVGRDLQGNKFYENPISANDRPKRTVEYAHEDDVWDYIGGKKRLAIQWSSWLSHTRPHPPTVEELEADMQRQMRLRYNVSLIEARDREESERMRVEKEQLLQVQGTANPAEGEPPVVQSAGKKASGHAQGQSETNSSSTPGDSPSDDPWAASKVPIETESWTPTLRRR